MHFGVIHIDSVLAKALQDNGVLVHGFLTFHFAHGAFLLLEANLAEAEQSAATFEVSHDICLQSVPVAVQQQVRANQLGGLQFLD